MKRSDLVKQQHYAATKGIASHQRTFSQGIRVEVLETGVERGYFIYTGFHGQAAKKNDGVRVRFLEDAPSFARIYGGKDGAMSYENGNCLKGGIGVIQARDIWMPWSEFEVEREAAFSKDQEKKAKLEDQADRAAAVVEAFGGRGEARTGSGIIGRPQVRLHLEDAEKIAAVVEAARQITETPVLSEEEGKPSFADTLVRLKEAIDEVPLR